MYSNLQIELNGETMPQRFLSNPAVQEVAPSDTRFVDVESEELLAQKVDYGDIDCYTVDFDKYMHRAKEARLVETIPVPAEPASRNNDVSRQLFRFLMYFQQFGCALKFCVRGTDSALSTAYSSFESGCGDSSFKSLEERPGSTGESL